MLANPIRSTSTPSNRSHPARIRRANKMDGLHINSGSMLINTRRHVQRKPNRDLAGSFECSKQSILSSMDKFVRTVQSMGSTVLVPNRLRDMQLRPRLPDCQITMLANKAIGHRPHTHSATGRSNKTKPSHSATKSTAKSHHKLHSHFHTTHYHHSLLHNHHLADYHRSATYHRSAVHSNIDCDPITDKENHDPAEIPSALMNADLFNFYSMLHEVKQQLLWGTSGQSTTFTNQSTGRFMLEKSALHQLNSTMANRNLNSFEKRSPTNPLDPPAGLSKKPESGGSSGYSSSNSSVNSSTRNSTTSLNFIATKCSSPASSIGNRSTSSMNSLSPVGSTRSLPSAQSSIEESPTVCLDQRTPLDKNDSVKPQLMNVASLDSNDSAVSSGSSAADIGSANSSDGKLADSPQSKTPVSDSDLESELESDSILIDRSPDQIIDQTQLLASAFRHHLQALHTILDQLTHSAEYLSKNYELDLDE